MQTRNLTRISLCTALLCITSYLIIPLPFTPIVISLQTIMINLIGLLFKPKEAGLTVLLYLLMGGIGLPVFSGGTSGPGKLFGPTGGFYFGFLAAVVMMSFFKGKSNSVFHYCVVTIAIGLPIQHLFAVLWMCIHNGWNISAAFLTVSLPFLAGDIIKCLMASTMAVPIRKING